MSRFVRNIVSPTLLRLSALSLVMIFAACDGGASGTATTAQDTTAGAASGAGADGEEAAGAVEEALDHAMDQALDPALSAALAAADAADGKTDRVVSKCMTCSLHMDGEEKYSAEAHGYTMHLCSENCLFRFERNPDRAIRALPTGGS